jgi:myo-inositol catabolism protein IolC
MASQRSAAQAPDPMYMLAFDHRKVLRDLYPSAQTADLQLAKVVVLDTLDALSDLVIDAFPLSFLVDEEYGAEAARLARERGHYVAMPIEASRTKALELQFPDDYQSRFEKLNPHCVKALVFHNPADDAARKAQQLGLLLDIGVFAQEQERDYLLEVLINPSPEQLAECGGDHNIFREKLFPQLLIHSIAEMQDFGIDPHIWKIEGLETLEDTKAVAAQAVSGGRDDVRCVVLGSGESPAKVASWLKNASAVPQFSGFAIGRTVWHQPLVDLFSGEISRAEAVTQMALTFTNLIKGFNRESVTATTGA